MSTTVTGPKGLEGITAANSGICYIDGDQGVLAYRGIDTSWPTTRLLKKFATYCGSANCPAGSSCKS